VYRQRSELWEKVGPCIATVFEFTERSVSSSLCRKVEQQSNAVLHTALFSRQCHCSTISVATAFTPVHFSQPSTAVQFIQSIKLHTVAEPVIRYVQCYHVANCTATLFWLFQNFITVRFKYVESNTSWKFHNDIIPVIISFLFFFHLTVWQS